MSLTAEETKTIVNDYQLDPKDTGSPEVQIAIMTVRIKKLTEHFKKHIHDHHSRRGLMRLVNHRRKLLSYLRAKDLPRFRSVVQRLGLRNK